MLLQMSTVLKRIVPIKSVSMSIHAKRMMEAVTNIFTANRAATFWIFLLRNETVHLCCLAVMVHIALSKRRAVTTKTKNHLLI